MNQKQEVRFLLTDLDYEVKEEGRLPTIKLYGKTNTAQILVKVHDFAPYFYVKKNPDIDFILKNDPQINQWQLGTETVILRRYFWAGEHLKLVKVFGRDPAKINEISREFEKLGMETFETDIPYMKRFLIDNNLKCLNVLTVKATKVEKKGNEMYLEASFRDITCVPEEETITRNHFYHLKVMSVNIKVAREEESLQKLWQRKNRPIISICVIYGSHIKPDGGKLFLLEDNSKDSEKKIIMEFIRVLQEVQPDILCTYQGDSFDFPYLFHRMRILGVPTNLLALFREDPCFYSRHILSYRIKGRMSFDLALRTWGIHPLSGKKGLYDISKEVLGKGRFDGESTQKIQLFKENTFNHEEILAKKSLWHLWQSWIMKGEKSSFSHLAKRCFYDSALIFNLYWNLGMPGWVETLRATGFPPAESNNCTERLNGEFKLMRYMRRKGVLIPKRPDEEQIMKNRLIRESCPHEGGTVLYPKGALHTGVLIADFRSMYPSVMIAGNIGGETLRQWIEASDYGDPKKLFDKQSQSCLSIMEETLIKKRVSKKNEIKRLMNELKETIDVEKRREIQDMIATLEREQNSMKIVANSMYGAHFYIRSRFYTQTLASAIADSARFYLLGIEGNLAEISKKIAPCELIYGDTDSAFIKIMDEKIFTEIYQEKNEWRREMLTANLMQLINSILKELNNQLPNPLELKFEDIAYRIIFKPERKKAYSYISLLTGELNVKGFEAVRADWSPLSRTAQRKVLEILLRHSEKSFKGETEFQIAKRFLIALGVKILLMSTEELLPKVVILTPIQRAPDAYKTKAPAVEAFKHYAKLEKMDITKEWMDYDKFPWVIVAGEGNIYDRARHPKYVDEIDREYYVKEMLRCCEDLGAKVSLKEVKGALPTGRLDHLFKQKQMEGLVEEELIEVKSTVGRQPVKEEAIFTPTIEPIKDGELGWKNKVKGIRRNVQKRRAAGQAALTLFSNAQENKDIDFLKKGV